MEPKVKAKELIEKFIEPTKVPNPKGVWVEDLDGAKQCALTAVDEILWALDDIENEINMGDFIPFWEEVKEEIEKI